MSTPQGGGGSRRPSVVSTGKKPAASKATPGTKATKAPVKTTGGKGQRKRIAPVKVSQGRAWGPIAVLAAVLLVALAIIGYASWYIYQGSITWDERANGIPGIVNFRKTQPNVLERNHQPGSLTYPMSPPVGGNHNQIWQNCMGDVYTAQIANEHAVHSLEHGAVWITYRPDLPADQVEKLASKVRGQEMMLMSPYPGLDAPISLQAWGYQLKVDNASDGRIDEFIKALRVNASLEEGAVCSGGITVTGTTPRDLQTGG